MNIELKGTVGDKIAIIGEITQVFIKEDGVTYCVKTGSSDEIEWIKDSSSVVEWDGKCESSAPNRIIDSVISEKNKDTETKSEDEIPKRRPGRPKKATVEGAMRKLEEMRAKGEA